MVLEPGQLRAASSGLDSGSSLEVLGIDAIEEHVYRVLLGRPGATLRELSDGLRLRPLRLRQVLHTLETKGLASRSATRPAAFSPAPPDVALEVLILQRRHALERVRLTAVALTELLNASRHATPSGVETITGRRRSPTGSSDSLGSLRVQLRAVWEQIDILRAENDQLRARPGPDPAATTPQLPAASPRPHRPGELPYADRHSPAPQKIALFRALFAGRSDIYATRWVSTRAGKKGWGPGCSSGSVGNALRAPGGR